MALGKSKWLSGNIGLSIAVIAFLAAAILSATRTYQTLSELLWNYRTGTWLLVEAQTELQGTLLAASKYRLDPTSERKDALALQFDLFWSRIPLILESDEGVDIRSVDKVIANTKAIAERLPRLDIEIRNIRVGQSDTAAAFSDDLAELLPLAEEMTRIVLVQDELRHQSVDLARGTWQTAIWFSVALIAGLALIGGNVVKTRRIHSLFTKQAEIEQIRATQLAAIESSGEGFAMFDKHGRLEYSNEAFHQLVRDDFKQTLTRAVWRRFVTPVSAMTILKGLRQGRARVGWNGEIVGRTLQGDRRSWEIHVLPRFEGGFTAVLRDLTDRKESERQRESFLDKLHRVDKMHAIGRVAGGVAHDFNNVLAAILGFGALLEVDLVNHPQQQSMVRQILSAGHKGKELVQSIMAFSRAEKADRSLIKGRDICREAATMAGLSISSPASFVVDIEDDDLLLQGNATQINRAIVNLCINARDALNGQRGIVTLDIRRVYVDGGRTAGMQKAPILSPADAPVVFEMPSPTSTKMLVGVLTRVPGPQLRIRVTDTGCGISHATMQQMFEPFFTTKGIGEGTGLGLSSVLGIAAAHGGAIAVESTVGKGTTFDILLPMTPDRERRVLVANEDPTLRDTLATLVSSIGFEPSICDSHDEAIDTLADEPDFFDGLIMGQCSDMAVDRELIAKLRQLGYQGQIVMLCDRDLSDERPSVENTMFLSSKEVGAGRLAAALRPSKGNVSATAI